jgi:hypothetical protein
MGAVSLSCLGFDTGIRPKAKKLESNAPCPPFMAAIAKRELREPEGAAQHAGRAAGYAAPGRAIRRGPDGYCTAPNAI